MSSVLRCVTNVKIRLRLRETLPVHKKAVSNMASNIWCASIRLRNRDEEHLFMRAVLIVPLILLNRLSESLLFSTSSLSKRRRATRQRTSPQACHVTEFGLTGVNESPSGTCLSPSDAYLRRRDTPTTKHWGEICWR